MTSYKLNLSRSVARIELKRSTPDKQKRERDHLHSPPRHGKSQEERQRGWEERDQENCSLVACGDGWKIQSQIQMGMAEVKLEK